MGPDQPRQLQQRFLAGIAPVVATLVIPAGLRPPEITIAFIGHAQVTLTLGTSEAEEVIGHDIEALSNLWSPDS